MGLFFEVIMKRKPTMDDLGHDAVIECATGRYRVIDLIMIKFPDGWKEGIIYIRDNNMSYQNPIMARAVDDLDEFKLIRSALKV